MTTPCQVPANPLLLLALPQVLDGAVGLAEKATKGMPAVLYAQAFTLPRVLLLFTPQQERSDIYCED